MRARPRANWNTPAMNVSDRAMLMYSALPGAACGLMALKMTMEIAVVGPEIRWNEEPNRAAITGGRIALYNPYSGGRPAMMAKATPCGSTMIAPVNPAIRSARRDLRVTRLFHCRNGKIAVHGIPDVVVVWSL